MVKLRTTYAEVLFLIRLSLVDDGKILPARYLLITIQEDIDIKQGVVVAYR